MKSSLKFSLLVAASILIPKIAAAQAAPQQWVIITTSESSYDAAPVQYTSTGQTLDCSGDNPDSTSSGACYNPLIYTFDFAPPSTSDGSFSGVSAASLSGPGGVNLLSQTNYVGSTDGYVSSITVSLSCSTFDSSTATCTAGDYEVDVMNEDESTFKFLITLSADPMTGLFESSNGDSNSDYGGADAYSQVPVESGAFEGSFENSTGSTTDTIVLNLPGANSNFSLGDETVDTESTSNVCFTGANHKANFSSADSLAMTYDDGYEGTVSGDVQEFTVGDGNGDVIGMLVTPDSSDSNEGVFEDPDNTPGTLYVTYYVLASTNAACPVGTAAYDAPFRPKPVQIPHLPIRWRPMLRGSGAKSGLFPANQRTPVLGDRF
jgi:hypothetical protein